MIRIYCIACMLFASLWAGILHDRTDLEGEDERGARISSHVTLVSDVAYGKHPKERFDVYAPQHTTPLASLPVIFMVHGGAWMIGDKTYQNVIENKVAYWVEQKGYLLVSINYPMLPTTPVSDQLKSVAKALGYFQANAEKYGGDKNKVVLMGHSAGAHLIAMLASSDALYKTYAITPPKAAVSLDSAVLDTPSLMSAKHLRLYDRAFGDNPAYWQTLSPYHQLSTKRMPFAAVCSTKRDDSCPQAKAFLEKAASLGTVVALVEEPMSHKDINALLGKELIYTKRVDDFIATSLER